MTKMSKTHHRQDARHLVFSARPASARTGCLIQVHAPGGSFTVWSTALWVSKTKLMNKFAVVEYVQQHLRAEQARFCFSDIRRALELDADVG